MLVPMLAKMYVLIDDLFVPGLQMIAERGELLALQNGVLERKKLPPGARSYGTEGLLIGPHVSEHVCSY